MTLCTAREICAAVGGTLLQDSGAPVTGVTTDSRAVQPGQLFIPLVGERFDGHGSSAGDAAAGEALYSGGGHAAGAEGAGVVVPRQI